MVIGGRVTDVDLALGHDDVRALALAKAAERGPRDSRRIGLAKEGQIAEGSPAWEDMPAGDRAKRKRAAGGWAAGWSGASERHYALRCSLCPNSYLIALSPSSTLLNAVCLFLPPPACPCLPLPAPACLPAEEKKLKLKSPNFVVSDTRLSVRNLPLSWTERQLKQAFIAAVSQGGRCRGGWAKRERQHSN